MAYMVISQYLIFFKWIQIVERESIGLQIKILLDKSRSWKPLDGLCTKTVIKHPLKSNLSDVARAAPGWPVDLEPW